MALADFAPYRLAMEECGSGLLEYAALHSAVTGMHSNHRKPEHASASLHGVLVIKPEHGGMGNVLRIIGQYALLGVLLGRLVCLELDDQDPRFPSAVSLRAQIHPFAHSPALDWRCLGVPTRSANAYVMHVSKRNSSVSELLHYFGSCDVKKDLSAFELVRIHADSTRVEPVLLSNPYLGAKQLVPRGRSAGACVRQLFLQPTKQTHAALSLYLNRLPFPRPYAAAHIRLGDRQMAGLGSTADLRVQPSHHNKLFQCVLARLMGASEQLNASTYFIATDNAEIIPELLQRSRMRAIFVPGTVVHTGAWASEVQRVNNVEGLQKVWLDHFLLSLGNGLLVSSGGRLSSFSEEAAARHTRSRGIVRCR